MLSFPLFLGLLAIPAAPLPSGSERVLALDDGRADDRRSTAGSGHAVRFELEEPTDLVGLAIHGSRYGSDVDPEFALARIGLFRRDGTLLARGFAPYAAWKVGRAEWVDVDFLSAVRAAGEVFAVVEFFPTARHGIYQSIDTDSGGHSTVWADGAPSRAVEGQWMIRLRASKRPLEAARADRTREQLLERGEGEPAGKRSTAGAGHAVVFRQPGKGLLLTGLEFCAERYGGGRGALFCHLFVCDRRLRPLWRTAVPYGEVPAGELDWVAVDLPDLEVPRDFALLVAPMSTQSRGIYLGRWAEAKPASLSALPGGKGQKLERGEGWMIRARVAPSLGKAPLAEAQASRAEAGLDALALAELRAEADRAEALEDIEALRAIEERLAAEDPEALISWPRVRVSEHFLLRSSGLDEPRQEALLTVMETAHDVLTTDFGFARVSAIEDRRVHLTVRIGADEESKLFTRPNSPEFSAIVWSGPPRVLEGPERGGPHVVYGLCHELGHVLIGWTDSRHQWAHYLGSVLASRVHERLGDAAWVPAYDVHGIEGLPRLEREIEGASPGRSDDASMARLFVALGETFGEERYGPAIAWILREREGEPFHAVRRYGLDDLRDALVELTGERKRVLELFGE